MTDTSYFNRRLMHSELDVWLEVGKETDSNDSIKFTKQFLNLENGMAFVSYIGEDLIGGTAIYKDPIRLGMALINTRVSAKYREQATTQIMKTAIPFFKSASIRDVDVLLNQTSKNSTLPSPLNTELEAWTKVGLDKNGFEEVSKVYSFELKITEMESEIETAWDAEPNMEGLQQLFWKNGPQCSNLSFLLDLQKQQGKLKTSAVGEGIQLVLGFCIIDKKRLMITVFQNTELIDYETVARTIVCESMKMDFQHIIFPILAEDQLKLIEAMEDLGANVLDKRELVLMRKKL